MNSVSGLSALINKNTFGDFFFLSFTQKLSCLALTIQFLYLLFELIGFQIHCRLLQQIDAIMPQSDCKISIARLCDNLNCWNGSELLLNSFSLASFTFVHPLNGLFPSPSRNVSEHDLWWSLIIVFRQFTLKMNVVVKLTRERSLKCVSRWIYMWFLIGLDWFRLTVIRWLLQFGHFHRTADEVIFSVRWTFPLDLNHKFFAQLCFIRCHLCSLLHILWTTCWPRRAYKVYKHAPSFEL